MKGLKIVFWGTPHFANEILKYLLNNNISISALVTQSDKPQGRKQKIETGQIKITAQENNIPLIQATPLTKKDFEYLSKIKPDIFIVSAYGAILSKKILAIPKLGTINVHPSLLPKLRGASPIQTALYQNYETTGSTIMLMNEKMDAGDIFIQKSIKINKDETYPLLEKRLINISNKLLLTVIKKIITKQELPHHYPQNNQRATFCSIIKKTDGLIDWQKSALEIYNQWRAFYSWPKIYSFFNKRKIIFHEIKLTTLKTLDKNRPSPGLVIKEKDKIFIVTQQGLIQIIKIQLAGKKIMSIQDFLNGQPEFINSILTS